MITDYSAVIKDIRTNPAEAAGYAATWEKFINDNIEKYPELDNINHADLRNVNNLWGQFIEKYPEFSSSDIINSLTYSRLGAINAWQEENRWQENPYPPEEEPGIGADAPGTILAGALGLLIRQQYGLLEYDPVYQKLMQYDKEHAEIREAINNGTATVEQKLALLEYEHGDLTGNENSLHAQTKKRMEDDKVKIKNKKGEEIEISKYKDLLEHYDKREKVTDRYRKDYLKDPRISYTKARIDYYIGTKRSFLEDMGQNFTEEQEKAYRQEVWKIYAAKNTEKARIYALKDDEIKAGLEAHEAQLKYDLRRKRIEDLERRGALRNTDEQLELTRAKAQEQGENEKAQQQQQGRTNIQLSSRPTPAEAIPEGIGEISQEEQLRRLEELRGKPGFLMGAEEKFELENLERQFAAAVGEEALGEAALAPEAIAGAEAAEAAAARAEEKNVVGGLLGKRGERNAARKAARLAGRAERKAEKQLALTAVRTALPVIGPIIAVIVIVLILMLGPLGGGGGETPASTDNNQGKLSQSGSSPCFEGSVQAVSKRESKNGRDNGSLKNDATFTINVVDAENADPPCSTITSITFPNPKQDVDHPYPSDAIIISTTQPDNVQVIKNDKTVTWKIDKITSLPYTLAVTINTNQSGTIYGSVTSETSDQGTSTPTTKNDPASIANLLINAVTASDCESKQNVDTKISYKAIHGPGKTNRSNNLNCINSIINNTPSIAKLSHWEDIKKLWTDSALHKDSHGNYDWSGSIQCVAFVNSVLLESYGKILDDIYGKHDQNGYHWLPNNPTNAQNIKPGDAAIFTVYDEGFKGNYGHVAIVTNVDSVDTTNTIFTVAEANALGDGGFDNHQYNTSKPNDAIEMLDGKGFKIHITLLGWFRYQP